MSAGADLIRVIRITQQGFQARLVQTQHGLHLMQRCILQQLSLCNFTRTSKEARRRDQQSPCTLISSVSLFFFLLFTYLFIFRFGPDRKDVVPAHASYGIAIQVGLDLLRSHLLLDRFIISVPPDNRVNHEPRQTQDTVGAARTSTATEPLES